MNNKLNFRGIHKHLLKYTQYDEDLAWDALSFAYLKLDTDRPVQEQASFLKMASVNYLFNLYKRAKTNPVTSESLLPVCETGLNAYNSCGVDDYIYIKNCVDELVQSSSDELKPLVKSVMSDITQDRRQTLLTPNRILRFIKINHKEVKNKVQISSKIYNHIIGGINPTY